MLVQLMLEITEPVQIQSPTFPGDGKGPNIQSVRIIPMMNGGKQGMIYSTCAVKPEDVYNAAMEQVSTALHIHDYR